VCKVCKEKSGKAVIVKFTAKSKSNLKSHFQTQHKEIQPEEKAAALGSQPLNQLFAPTSFNKQEQLTAAIVDMVVANNQPLSFVESPTFRTVLAVATSSRYKPVCRQTLRNRVMQKGLSWSFNPTIYIPKYGKPSTTVDLWTSRARRGQMAVSLHHNTEHGLKTKVLDFVHIPSPHTAENISLVYDSVLAKHGMDRNDTFKVVCDNASNMKKAFKTSLWENDEDKLETAEAQADGEWQQEEPMGRRRCRTWKMFIFLNFLLDSTDNPAPFTHFNYM
jgi:hypothetical protein